MVFFVNLPLIVMLLVFLIAGVAEWTIQVISAMLNVTFIFLLIKNIVQDCWFGLIKQKKTIKQTLLSLFLDLTRTISFWLLMRRLLGITEVVDGFNYLVSIFDFIFVYVCYGPIYLLAEMLSTLSVFSQNNKPKAFLSDTEASIFATSFYFFLVFLLWICWL